LAKVELRANAKLERLILANNSISELSDVRLDGLPSLGSLHLEDNKIQMIADGDLLPLKASAKLAALTLDGNNISWIGCDAFEPLPTLLVLSLQRNKISSLSCSSTRDPDPTCKSAHRSL
jgi:Leucine-rich repeat (LRR) protein